MDDEKVTAKEAAKMLDVSVHAVYAMIKHGRLHSQRFGRAHVIRVVDVESVQIKRKKPPPKKYAGRGRKRRD